MVDVNYYYNTIIDNNYVNNITKIHIIMYICNINNSIMIINI